MRRLLLLALLALAACGDDGADQGYEGYLEGEYRRIAAPDSGWIASIDVARGARIAAGTLLFTLDPVREQAALAQAQAQQAQAESELADMRLGARPDEIAAIEAQLNEAQATLHLAELTLTRQAELVRTRAVPQTRYDDARTAQEQATAQVRHIEAQLATARLPSRPDRIRAAEATVDAARQAVEQARWRLDQRRIASPAEGLVDDVVRRPGEWVPANGVVVSLLPPGAIRAVFFVPEARRAEIRPGMNVALSCTGCPPDVTARVSRVASEAEFTPPVIFSRETREKLVFRIEALLEPREGAPLPGQPITARPRP
ncbi:HlyD family secretion protein [Roseococcus sp. YIM B11640]|uniref:HlyD family secretion protein n=1 Tax=Roseococcus sp. YIM B11640 TaxID=3133973 RepID=UPI003C7DFC68